MGSSEKLAAPLTMGRAPIAVAALGLATISCFGRSVSPATYRGVVIDPPGTKPDFVLTTTTGRPFAFRRETDGFVTLLFFGYTNCPDVCPIHLANISAVLHKLRPSLSGRVRVVFVTVDPARDSRTRLGRWLAQFDPSFIGLTGDTSAIDAAERAARVPPTLRERLPNGSTAVGHYATVIAYTRDNRERVRYPFGTRQEDWAHDLPLLVADSGP
jgi:protein SCO1/2